MRVEYARRAQTDLAEFHSHIVVQNPTTATSIALEIKFRCEDLANNPFLNPSTDVRNVRRMPLTRYPFTVYYRTGVEKGVILILRVVRSSRIRNLGRVPR